MLKSLSQRKMFLFLISFCNSKTDFLITYIFNQKLMALNIKIHLNNKIPDLQFLVKFPKCRTKNIHDYFFSNHFTIYFSYPAYDWH